MQSLLDVARFFLFLEIYLIPAVYCAGHRDALCFFQNLFESIISLADGTFEPECKLRKNSPGRQWIYSRKHLGLRDRETWMKILVLASVQTSTSFIFKMEVINLTSKWSYEDERGSELKNTKEMPDTCLGRKLFWKAPHFFRVLCDESFTLAFSDPHFPDKCRILWPRISRRLM